MTNSSSKSKKARRRIKRKVRGVGDGELRKLAQAAVPFAEGNGSEQLLDQLEKVVVEMPFYKLMQGRDKKTEEAVGKCINVIGRDQLRVVCRNLYQALKKDQPNRVWDILDELTEKQTPSYCSFKTNP